MLKLIKKSFLTVSLVVDKNAAGYKGLCQNKFNP